MRRVAETIVLLAWALWFGGCATLFVTVMALFSSDRTVAIQAAPRIFLAFGKYQLVLAAIAVVGAFLFQVVARPRFGIWIFILFGLAAVGACALAGLIVPRMEVIRLAENSASPEYAMLHRNAERVYTAETLALLAAGLILPAAIASKGAARENRTMPETAPAPSAPA